MSRLGAWAQVLSSPSSRPTHQILMFWERDVLSEGSPMYSSIYPLILILTMLFLWLHLVFFNVRHANQRLFFFFFCWKLADTVGYLGQYLITWGQSRLDILYSFRINCHIQYFAITKKENIKYLPPNPTGFGIVVLIVSNSFMRRKGQVRGFGDKQWGVGLKGLDVCGGDDGSSHMLGEGCWKRREKEGKKDKEELYRLGGGRSCMWLRLKRWNLLQNPLRPNKFYRIPSKT